MSHDEIELSHTNDCDKPADQPIEHVREDSATRRGDDAIAEELVAPLLAERSAMAAAIAKLTAEVDGLRLLDESNRLEMERVRAALHAKKDETTSVAAARVWSELLAAEGRGRDVLSALGRPIIEDPVKAAQRAIAERDSLKAELARLHGADEREWDALRADRDLHLEKLRNIRAALGVGEGWTTAALIERAGQLRDDSVAYRSLRGKLVGMLGCPADFSEKDVADMIADRINGPITDAEDDLVEQVQQLEGDVCALKAALHVATRGQS